MEAASANLTSPAPASAAAQPVTAPPLSAGKPAWDCSRPAAKTVPQSMAMTDTRPNSEHTTMLTMLDALHPSLPMDDADFREIVEMFVDRLRERVPQIRAAAEEGDFAKLAELAHWLKGAGGTAGFNAFTEPSGNLQNAAKSQNASAVGPLVQEIETLCQRIRIQTSTGPVERVAVFAPLPLNINVPAQQLQ
jgi:HPt (histidine-containing phosphotransfer) domain-containing protein